MQAVHKLFILAALVLAVGCAQDPLRFDPNFNPPPPSQVNLQPAPNTPASLFNQVNSDLFTDLRARRAGDLIFVEVVENARARKKNDTKAERKNTYNAGITKLNGYENDLPLTKDGSLAQVEADFQSKHDTKSEMNREDTMTTSIGCTVMEVLPGGTMLIRGSREIRVNGETQYIILQGKVRPVDVTSDNTVLSTQLADARIYYTGRGVLTDKQNPGWAARLLDHIWPF
ncbi:MAG: flagellar basal body L-ring protein FlgH [Deltaproteobacteria bacterium]|nr:flagellar basal body L-ring protein FlgH [Deltaproteobacteria bacterium]